MHFLSNTWGGFSIAEYNKLPTGYLEYLKIPEIVFYSILLMRNSEKKSSHGATVLSNTLIEMGILIFFVRIS